MSKLEPIGVIEKVNLTGKMALDAFVYLYDSTTNEDGQQNTDGFRKYPKGTEVTISKKSSKGFYYVNSPPRKSGWVLMGTVQVYTKNSKLEKIDKDDIEVAKMTYSIEQYNAMMKNLSKITLGDNTDLNTSLNSNKTIKATTTMFKKSLNGIHGVPYQFMPDVDMRNDSTSSIGMMYADRIVAKMPLLLLTPGAPDFLSSFNDKERGGILEKLINGVGKGQKGTELENILKNSGRYYTFKFDYTNYYKYVDDMLHECALMLNIHDTYHGNGLNSGYVEKLGKFKWSSAVNNELRGFINAQEYVAFYMDSDTTRTEQLGNNTVSSSLMEKVNDMRAYVREIQFLAGPIAGKRVKALDDSTFNATMEDIQKIGDKFLGGTPGRIFNKLGEQFATVGKGGKILFPEIWDDSDFSVSQSFSIKLRTPDSDPYSWYINICVPLIHLLCMAAPRSLGPNGYKAPFLVRAYSRGLINVDMGIITNMSISKGKEGSWTRDGLPTEVDVNVDIKDLYSSLMITNIHEAEGIRNFLNNTSLMDYLATSCGVNIHKPELERTIENFILLNENKISGLYTYNWLKLQNGISNMAMNAYSVFSGNKKIIK